MRERIISRRWLDYQPPSLCGFDFGIGEALAAVGLSSAAEAGTAAAVGATAAEAGTAAALGTGGLYAAEAGTAAGVGFPSLGTIGTVLSAGGTLLQAKAGADNSAYQAAVARSEADSLKLKANEDAAAAERQQISRERQTELTQSRLRALGAASGTDASSPDIVNTEAGIAQQGEYNALSALYEGQARARSDLYQSNIDLYKASRIQSGAGLAAGGTILSGISSFVNRRLRRNYLLDSWGASL